MMRINVPAKTLVAHISSSAATEKWPYNDGLGDPYWAGGTNPKPYRWELTMSIDTQFHGSHLTREPNVYTGLDIQVGDWLAGAGDGTSLKIISIRSKTDSTLTCVVEDVLRYNTFRSSLGDGLFSLPGEAIIFELNEDGDPVIDPISAGAVGAFHREDVWLFEQASHGFAEGNLISINSSGSFVRTSSSTLNRIVGTVNDTVGTDAFLVRPVTKILENYEPAMPGSKGSYIYASTSSGSDLTTTKTAVLSFLQLTDSVPTVTDATVANATTTTGNQIKINGTTITLNNNGGGTESIDDVVADINLQSGTTGVTASKVTIARTSLTLVYGVVAAIISPAITLNGSAVTFSDDSYGQYEFGAGLANERDFANSINAAAISNIEASYNNEELVIVETTGAAITIVNTVNDGGANPFAGPSSCSGVPLSNTDTFLRLERADGGEIILQNVTGSPIQDLGTYSTHNGALPIALTVEQGIRKGDMYVAADITARDALSVLTGDQAYVIDKGDGEWGQYLWTGSTWVVTSTEESARVDSRTLSADITFASPTDNVIGEVNSGVRVSLVSVNVTGAFDGSPTISVGDAGNTSRLVDNALVDLATVSEYIIQPTYQYTGGSDTEIKITFSAGGATTGAATVTITYS